MVFGIKESAMSHPDGYQGIPAVAATAFMHYNKTIAHQCGCKKIYY
jgi:hypothetical protein